MKSYAVNIQRKPPQQYFQMVGFVFKHFIKRHQKFCLILTLGNLGSERVKIVGMHESTASDI